MKFKCYVLSSTKFELMLYYHIDYTLICGVGKHMYMSYWETWYDPTNIPRLYTYFSIRCFNLPWLLPNPINILIYKTMFLTNKIVLGLCCQPTPTNAPWRMDGKWIGNNFLLGFNSLVNDGTGYPSSHFQYLTTNNHLQVG